MDITATETHRLGARAHVVFTDGKGGDLLPGGRYIDVADWDADPDAIIAALEKELSAMPLPPVKSAPVKPPVTMNAADIALKQAAIEAAKLNP